MWLELCQSGGLDQQGSTAIKMKTGDLDPVQRHVFPAFYINVAVLYLILDCNGILLPTCSASVWEMYRGVALDLFALRSQRD